MLRRVRAKSNKMNDEITEENENVDEEEDGNISACQKNNC